jgi:hypothetical protein
MVDRWLPGTFCSLLGRFRWVARTTHGPQAILGGGFSDVFFQRTCSRDRSFHYALLGRMARKVFWTYFARFLFVLFGLVVVRELVDLTGWVTGDW